jgi:DNA-binding transcriptional MerR regulator
VGQNLITFTTAIRHATTGRAPQDDQTFREKHKCKVTLDTLHNRHYDEYQITDTAGRTRVKEREKRGLRMREVTEATGLPKSTILHYVAQGLLPQPVRTGRNMAYYDPTTVDRAKFIRSMQEKYSFPLERIRKLLTSMDEGRDIAPLVELDTVIFGTKEIPELDQKAFEEATGLTGEQIAELMTAQLLLPLKEGLFADEDVEAGRVFAVSFARGLKATDLSYYAAIAKDIVDHEMRLRKRLTDRLPDGEDARVTAQLTQGARLLRNYVIDRVFQRRVAAATSLKDKELLS